MRALPLYGLLHRRSQFIVALAVQAGTQHHSDPLSDTPGASRANQTVKSPQAITATRQPGAAAVCLTDSSRSVHCYSHGILKCALTPAVRIAGRPPRSANSCYAILMIRSTGNVATAIQTERDAVEAAHR